MPHTQSSTQILVSSDGCQIFSNAIGEKRSPCIIFIHGFTLCGDVWDNIFQDPRYYSEFYLVGFDLTPLLSYNSQIYR